MEKEPTEPIEGMATKWMKYGQMILLIEYLQVSREDWTGYGSRLWAQRKLEEIQGDV